MTSDLVPFGKYKGRPVDDLLADADYMAWLEAQPWFRERFRHILARRDADAMSRTPVHNRLQAMFLEPSYCRAFVEVAEGTWLAGVEEMFAGERASGPAKLLSSAEAWSAEALERYAGDGDWNRIQRDKYAAKATGMRSAAGALAASLTGIDIKSAFEAERADVRLRVMVSGLCVVDCSDYGCREIYYEAHKKTEQSILRIEIKPTVADEYPAVLRQMGRNESSHLFVDRYEGEGATEEQFVAIFAASGKKVVFKRDVDARLGMRPKE